MAQSRGPRQADSDEGSYTGAVHEMQKQDLLDLESLD